jgi:hypothetical protein
MVSHKHRRIAKGYISIFVVGVSFALSFLLLAPLGHLVGLIIISIFGTT